MKNYAIYFWPRGSLASMPSSDTLFGAVCWGIQLLGIEEDVGQLLSDFKPPQFAFSNPYPVYKQAEHLVRFYPRPAWLTVTADDMARLAAKEQEKDIALNDKQAKALVSKKVKQFKKIQFFSEKLFNKLITAQLDAYTLLSNLAPPKKASKGKTAVEQIGPAAISTPERNAISPRGALIKWVMEKQATQHTHIDRISGTTAGSLLFYENETFFSQGGGLWCLLKTTPKLLESHIKPALRYLADSGLGANRTAGKGHFDIVVEEAPPLPDAGSKANGVMMLSNYLPAPDELKQTDGPLAYNLITMAIKREQKIPRPIDGQATWPVYKQRLRMFTPGSLFPYQHQDIYGQLVDVTVDGYTTRRTWQSGLAIGLAVNVPQPSSPNQAIPTEVTHE